MKKIPLHIQIILGLVLGIAFGIASIVFGWPAKFTTDWIAPIGIIFINSLKMIAVPLVIASLISGVANLGDVSKLSRIGGKTIGFYFLTTIIATTIGLLVVNTLEPGNILPTATRDELLELYKSDAGSREQTVEELRDQSPLQPLVDMVPQNVFYATTINEGMLQVVFFALLLGIAILKIPAANGKPLIEFFSALNDAIIKIVEFIMIIAPYGVFALMAALIVDLAGDNPERAWQLLTALGAYTGTVLLGLGAMIFCIYPLLFKLFTRVKYKNFFKGIRPAQLLAFSTSSSSATLPVTMRQVEEELGVSEEVSSFVLPLGATINMDGTSLYQSVAAVFIAQALGMGLSIADQLMIVMTATLASIGSAGVPGAGLVMLIIVLESIGVPSAGIALIIAPDRILDMIRTVVNVTGDATVTMIVASTEGEDPHRPEHLD